MSQAQDMRDFLNIGNLERGEKYYAKYQILNVWLQRLILITRQGTQALSARLQNSLGSIGMWSPVIIMCFREQDLLSGGACSRQLVRPLLICKEGREGI